MSSIHDEHQTHEVLATFEVVVNRLLPFDLFVPVCTCKAETGKIHESPPSVGIEEINQLRSTGRLADSSQFF